MPYTEDEYEELMGESELAPSETDKQPSKISYQLTAQQISNLTQEQCAQLLGVIEQQKEIHRARIDELALIKHRFETCSQAIPEALRQRYLELKEAETALQMLTERSEQLSKITTIPEKITVPPAQIVLCSPWTDKVMPKVILCPRSELGEKGKMNAAFKEYFSPKQLRIIENEKSWVNVSCGEMEAQLASIKGKINVINNDNSELKRILQEEMTSSPRKRQKITPCSRDGSAGTRMCPMSQAVPDISIDFDSKRINDDDGGFTDRSGRPPQEELDEMERELMELMKQVEEAKKDMKTLECLKSAIHCAYSDMKKDCPDLKNDGPELKKTESKGRNEALRGKCPCK